MRMHILLGFDRFVNHFLRILQKKTIQENAPAHNPQRYQIIKPLIKKKKQIVSPKLITNNNKEFKATISHFKNGNAK